MSEESVIGPNGEKRVFIKSSDRSVQNETSRSIRKVMETVERYTNYDQLDPMDKDRVRDTILNQMNRLVRIVKNKQTIVFGDPYKR
jgi:hypothetical protein